jgi:WD40 repeat protein
VAIYRTSVHAHRERPLVVRRQILTLDAARWGDHEMAARLQTTPVTGHPLPIARIEWATGSSLSPAQIGMVTGHIGAVCAVAVGELDRRPIAVTGSSDCTARIWDLTTRAAVGDPLTGHTGAVTAVAVGELDGRPVAVTGSRDEAVRIWDLARRVAWLDLPATVKGNFRRTR